MLPAHRGAGHRSTALARDRACTVDDDCVVIDAPCNCDESETGARVAVNSGRVAEATAALGPGCAAEFFESYDPSCQARAAACIYDTCELEPQ